MGRTVMPSHHVSWFVETQGATLWSRDGRVRHSIPYPHAGMWALIANGNFSKTCAAELMSILMDISLQKAEIEVEETIAVWLELGFLSEE